MKILITGATGFIGTYLIEYLRSSHELFLITRCQDQLPEHKNVIVWDFMKPLCEADFPDQLDVIIHLAQARNYRDLMANSEEMFQVNTVATLELAKLAVKTQVKHFCYISSGTVYESNDSLLREDQCLSPSNFLGASKYAAELLFKPFEAFYSTSILRLFTPYGPNQKDRLIPTLIQRIMQKQPVMLTGDNVGSCFGVIYYRDILAVIERAITEHWQGVYNIANETCLSIRDMAQSLGECLGLEPVFDCRPDLPKVKLCPDVAKLSSKISDLSLIDCVEGFGQTVDTLLRKGKQSERV